jgi:hypothetical protein
VWTASHDAKTAHRSLARGEWGITASRMGEAVAAAAVLGFVTLAAVESLNHRPPAVPHSHTRPSHCPPYAQAGC